MEQEPGGERREGTLPSRNNSGGGGNRTLVEGTNNLSQGARLRINPPGRFVSSVLHSPFESVGNRAGQRPRGTWTAHGFTRAERRAAARELAREYGVPFSVGAKAALAITTGKAAPEFAAAHAHLVGLPKFRPLVEIERNVLARPAWKK
jgi:hypothetical protein